MLDLWGYNATYIYMSYSAGDTLAQYVLTPLRPIRSDHRDGYEEMMKSLVTESGQDTCHPSHRIHHNSTGLRRSSYQVQYKLITGYGRNMAVSIVALARGQVKMTHFSTIVRCSLRVCRTSTEQPHSLFWPVTRSDFSLKFRPGSKISKRWH